jgi:hypothetical protein
MVICYDENPDGSLERDLEKLHREIKGLKSEIETLEKLNKALLECSEAIPTISRELGPDFLKNKKIPIEVKAAALKNPEGFIKVFKELGPDFLSQTMRPLVVTAIENHQAIPDICKELGRDFLLNPEICFLFKDTVLKNPDEGIPLAKQMRDVTLEIPQALSLKVIDNPGEAISLYAEWYATRPREVKDSVPMAEEIIETGNLQYLMGHLSHGWGNSL